MIPRLVAVLALVAVGITGLGLWLGSRPYEVNVYFLSAERVVAGNDVNVGGVVAGKVRSVTLAPDGDTAGAIARIEIDGKYAPLDRGTRALIRPKGLLGTMYVELKPSHSHQPIPSGGNIPLQDTETPVSLDQVTDVFDDKTRQRLQTLTRQGAVALQDRGPDINTTLQQLPAISSNLAATSGALDQRTRELEQLQLEFDRLAYMAAGEDRALRGDLTNGASLLNTLAQHQQGLQSELIHANRSLGQANAAVGGNEQNINRLLKDMPALLDQLQTFQTSGTTALQIINPCMNDLLATLAEMRSATGYKQPAGATDGAGFMLRVDPQLVGPSTGSYSPSAACSGGGGK